MAELDTYDVWIRVVALLSGGETELAVPRTERRAVHGVPAALPWPADVKIRVLDRVSSRSISVALAHPCLGYCGWQRWHRALARKSGICVLSGDSVSRGDVIYKLAGSFTPSRADHVMLARHVDVTLESQG